MANEYKKYKLNKITPSYHAFTDDQLLTANQLNEMLTYLEDQERLTRVSLTGVGIICGFNVSIGSSQSIIVSQGVGVTTDGDLFKLTDAAPPTPAEGYEKSLRTIDIALNQKTYTHYKTYLNPVEAEYLPFLSPPATGNPQIGLWELCESDEDGIATALSGLPASDFNDMVVILYLESYPLAGTACSAASCDNLGEENVQVLRALITRRADAYKIIQTDSIYKENDLYTFYTSLPDFYLKRLVLTDANTANLAALKTEYYNTMNANSLLSNFKTSLFNLYDKFTTTTRANTIVSSYSTLFGFNSGNVPTDFQYRYDLLKDLLETYAEIKELILFKTTTCSPSTNSFSKHLLLGRTYEPNPYKTYRHRFYQSPALGEGEIISRFNSLLNRLELMLTTYTIGTGSVKITPSHSDGNLGDKAIPFYYNVSSILKSWDFEKTKIYKEGTNLSYHTAPLLNIPPIQQPLAYHPEEFDFYRVEGYFTDSVDTSKLSITTAITANGLDFDMKVVQVKDSADSLNNLLKKHPSIEHKAGVKKGGTLLLVKDSNKLVADFAIDYRIPEPVTQNNCCYLVQCTYPWISSLNYINNLSRSLKGTQSQVKTMPKYYRIEVLNYSINGKSLISGPVIVSVPLSDIFLRRLHVVMDKLNSLFPTGLVFEYMEDLKKFRITKLEKDTFVIRFRDVTLGNNAPTYTYTELGQTRNGQPFGNTANACQLRLVHNPEAYKQLHTDMDPVNRDDDYGTFENDWGEIDAVRKRLRNHTLFSGANFTKRYPKLFSELPETNIDEINIIKTDVLAVDPQAKITLYGDWASGSWVNDKMWTYYHQHINDNADDVVRFIKLRKELHNKSGMSKYVLHIETTKVSQVQTAVVAKHKGRAEFYFQKPSMSTYAIQIV